MTCVEFSKPSHTSDRAGMVGSLWGSLVERAASRVLPERLRAPTYRAYARAVGANLDEVELELEAYPSLGDFFVRKLKDGARKLDRTEGAIVSPCDGVIAARGLATDGTLFQAKGRNYRLAELVADEGLAAILDGGDYMTIYLSPKDYHRVHTPVDARVESYDYLPGLLWPVNPFFATRRDGLLSRNERVVIRLDAGAAGTVAFVMVAAVGVGNVELKHGLDSLELRASGERRAVDLDDLNVKRGDELGAFRLGSTIVMIFERGKGDLMGMVGDTVRFGQRVGSVPAPVISTAGATKGGKA